MVNYLKKLCQKIKEFQKNNKSKFNYFTGEEAHDNTRQINDLNYKEIIDNKNKTLNKNDVLRQLREHKNEFKTYSIKQIKQKLIKKEINNKEEDIKTKILNVINTYSEYNIKNEWETMRKVWYQNNQRFNPIFKFNDKIEKLNEAIRKSAACNFNAGGRSGVNNNGNNPGGIGDRDGVNNIFSKVQNVQTNQQYDIIKSTTSISK